MAGFFTDWGEKTIRWGIHSVNFILWYLWGPSDLMWFTVTIALHALTATLLFTLLRKLFLLTGFKYGHYAGLGAMILFLCSPYHSETIVWGATLFYITFSAAFLGIIHCYLRYAETRKKIYILLLYILYLFSLVTFEEFMIVPMVLLILYWLTATSKPYAMPAKHFSAAFLLPTVALIGLFFVWNKWLIGKWVGHYGAEVHFNSDIFLLTANFTRYLLKYGYIHLFFSYGMRDKVYQHLGEHKWLWLLFTIYATVGIGALFLFFGKGVAAKWKMLSALFLLFVITLLPVLNLLFPYTKDIEQDRYMYVASLFFYAFFAMALFLVFRKAAFILIGMALCISLFYLYRNIMCWHEVGRVNNNLSSTFKWRGAKRIFILLNADNYGGAYQMRDMPQSAFAEILYVQRHIDIAKKSYDLLQYNVNCPNDSCYHEIIDSNTIRITFAQWGNWFWYKSYGAHSYDSTLYKVDIDQWNHSFTARFKDKKEGDVYIYQARDRWVEVKGF